jgi:hypothetical protein
MFRSPVCGCDPIAAPPFQICKCCSQIGMAEPLLDSPRVHACSVLESGVGLAELMELELALGSPMPYCVSTRAPESETTPQGAVQ